MTLLLNNIIKLLAISFGVFLVLAAIAGLWIMGSVTVRDPERQVASARVVTSDGKSQPLYLLPGRLFYSVPRLEGEIEVHCRTGMVQRAGYVSANMSTEVEVVRGSNCGLSYFR